MVGLKAVIDENTQRLILGSFPSGESLAKQQYYANPRNQFWQIMGSLLNFEVITPYSKKMSQLLKNGTGVWDVFHSCERRGSLDKDIQDAKVNDFEDFFSKLDSIKEVYFNGGKAEESFYSEFQGSEILEKLRFKRLPSSSPANTKLSFEKKLKVWSVLKG